MLQNNRFQKANNFKLLQKRHRASGAPAQGSEKETSLDRMDYHQFEKNVHRMNPRMAGSKNPRLDKLEKKYAQQYSQNQMVQQMQQFPMNGMYPQQQMFGSFNQGMMMNAPMTGNIQIQLLQKEIQLLQMQQQQQQMLMQPNFPQPIGNFQQFPQQMPGMMPMQHSQGFDDDDQDEDEEDITEKDSSKDAPQQTTTKQNSKQKKTSPKKRSNHDSPLKKEVAQLQEAGKMSPISSGRRAAEKAKRALAGNKSQAKAPVDSGKDKSN